MNQERDQTKEDRIDLSAMIKTVWGQRKKVIKWAIWGLIAGIVIAFSIPKQYTSRMKLAPESQTKQLGGSAGALASMMGVASSTNDEGINEKVYPEVISSTPFLLEFATIEVNYKGEAMTLSNYILKHTKRAWWSYIFALPGQTIDLIASIGKEKDDTATIENSPAIQYAFAGTMDRGIKTTLDSKLGIISIQSTFQDPVITKTVSDSLIVKLQRYMSDYRTAKTRNVLTTTSKLLAEAKERYYQADETYARAMDRNQNLITKSAAIGLDRLRNERDLAYRVYSQLAEQVEASRIKLQEETPVATIIEPPTTPIGPSAPSKMLIIVGLFFLAAFTSVLTIVIKQVLQK